MSGLFRGVASPPKGAAKGCCYFCERSKSGIATGAVIVAEGEIYICVDCVETAAAMCGFETREELRTKLEKYRHDSEIAFLRISSLESDNRQMRERLESLRKIANDLFPETRVGAVSVMTGAGGGGGGAGSYAGPGSWPAGAAGPPTKP